MANDRKLLIGLLVSLFLGQNILSQKPLPVAFDVQFVIRIQ